MKLDLTIVALLPGRRFRVQCSCGALEIRSYSGMYSAFSRSLRAACRSCVASRARGVRIGKRKSA